MKSVLVMKTRICKTCDGDGASDLWPDDVCGACHGSGEVPASWWWDAEGTLHEEPESPDLEETMAEQEPTRIGDIDGWTITQPRAGALEATKDGQRPCRVFGRVDADPAMLRERLFAAMAEADGVAAGGNGGSADPARAGAVGHAPTIVVHDEEGN